MAADLTFPVRSRKLDDHLAFVRQEARNILSGDPVGHVDMLNAALRIKYTLERTRWTQRRYPQFTLTERELATIRRFVDQTWQSSGERTTREVKRLAEVLVHVGRSRL